MRLVEEEAADRRQRRRLRALTNNTAAIALSLGLVGLFAVIFLGPASVHASAMQLIGVIVGAAAASLWSSRAGADN